MTRLLTPTASVLIGGVPLPVESGWVELDETRTYGAAEFTLPLEDVADVDSIDPREALRTLITLNGRTFDLGVRERRVDHASREVIVTAASDEMLLVDYAPLANNTALVGMASNLRGIVNHVLSIVIPGAALEPGTTTAVVAEPDALLWQAGVSAWEFLLNLCTAAGLRLFCDEQRKWRLVPSTYIAPGVVTAVPANSSAGEDVISREGEAWVDGVIFRYRWTDSAGNSHERIDAAGTAGKVDVVDMDRPYPGPGAARARMMRLRGQGRTQSASMTGQPDATPGMEARLTLPGTRDQIGRLQRVRWDLVDGWMEVTARELTEAPDSAWIKLPSGEAWVDSPLDESWIDEVV